MPDFEHAPVRAGALETVVPAGILRIALQLGFRIRLGTELAAPAKIADIVGIVARLAEKRVRQVEDLLKISVPRGQPQVFVEHDDAVTHIIEGDAQFGLALRQFGGALVDQPLEPDRRLGAVGEQFVALDRVLAKDLDRPAHFGDLVVARRRHRRVATAGGNIEHRAAQAVQAADNVVADVAPDNHDRCYKA